MEPCASYPDLRGKVVVVTGGTKGIGLATAELLSENGCRVIVNGRDPDGTDAAARKLAGGGAEALAVAADVATVAGVEHVRDAALQRFGRIDGIAAFAGGFAARTPLHEITDGEWDEVIRQNLTATFYALRAFIPALEQTGGGSVVTMASNAGRLLDIPLTASYAAAKAGVIMLTRHTAKECGASGVRVNCVAPATTLSPRVERLMSEEVREELAGRSPLGRLGTPQDTANATVFLLSDASSWLTGVTLDIAGGRVML